MGIDWNNPYRNLRVHLEHRIVLTAYGCCTDGEPEELALECETCNIVLLDFGREDDEDFEGEENA